MYVYMYTYVCRNLKVKQIALPVDALVLPYTHYMNRNENKIKRKLFIALITAHRQQHQRQQLIEQLITTTTFQFIKKKFLF